MRLIDADALKAYLREQGWITNDPFDEVGDLEEIIDEIPTIERPHGKWDRGFCSVCGERSLRTTQTGEIFGIEHTPFCKNCGADMRTKDGKICETMMGW